MIQCKLILLILIIDLISIPLFATNYHVKENRIKLGKEINKFNISTPNDRTKRKVIMGHSNKWTLPIYYNLLEPVNPFMVAIALYEISKETCIKFERRKILPSGSPGIFYHWVGGCRSFVGKQLTYGWQVIQLGEYCNNTGGVIHETLHALGLFHEHCRYDSKKYVKFQKHNMLEGGDNEFDSVCFAYSYDYYLTYDYGSIMHYGSYFHSSNYKKTIVPTDPNYVKTIGQMERLSFIDIKTLNLRYCTGVCLNKLTCSNHGYQDPKNCKVCRCVEGFSGILCEKYAKPGIGCTNTLIKVDRKSKIFLLKGKKNCAYHIKTYPNKRILLSITKLYMYPNNNNICYYKNSLEINYQIDKSVTGARFCSSEYDKQIKSHNNYVIVYYRSYNFLNFAFLEFKAIDYRKNSFNTHRRRLKSI